jgi:phosphoglycerate-specific signal transduction histidine kinase
MQKAKARAARMEKRRTMVTEFWAQGLSTYQIAEALFAEGITNKGKPYSHVTVASDIIHVKEQWRQKQYEHADVLIAEELAKLDRLEATAHKEGKYELVLKVQESRRKLMGWNAPDRVRMDVANHVVLPPELLALIQQLGLSSADVAHEMTALLQEMAQVKQLAAGEVIEGDFDDAPAP